MKAKQILEVLENLAKVQSFFGILLAHVKEDNSILRALENHNFKNEEEFIAFIKC